jgi:sulfate permease, SulP family
VNEGAGARSCLSLVIASLTLALCLLFFTALLVNLPKAVLAAVVLVAVRGLIDVRALAHMWRASRVDFFNALAALIGVLLLGVLQGILLAALISVLLLLALSSTPHVAFLGRIPGTRQFSDIQRHPENERLVGVLACRPEVSLLYLNADHVLGRILAELNSASGGSIQTVICDLSASPIMDLAGVSMLAMLQEELGSRGADLVVTNAHGRVRDLMRAEGLDQRIRAIARGNLLESELANAMGSTPA